MLRNMVPYNVETDSVKQACRVFAGRHFLSSLPDNVYGAFNVGAPCQKAILLTCGDFLPGQRVSQLLKAAKIYGPGQSDWGPTSKKHNKSTEANVASVLQRTGSWRASATARMALVC